MHSDTIRRDIIVELHLRYKLAVYSSSGIIYRHYRLPLAVRLHNKESSEYKTLGQSRVLRGFIIRVLGAYNTAAIREIVLYILKLNSGPSVTLRVSLLLYIR